MNYRPDIDGIRAVAVLAVLIFHIWGAALPGGFAGVDVFFVISGYLITKGLVEEIDGRGLSLTNFYFRRVRRIIPALFVVLIASLAAGYFILLPGDYAIMGKSAAFAAFGLANFFFYENTGYFDPAAELQPLLHTWSLGVEEQFYFVWPAALAVGFWLAKGRRSIIAAVVGSVIVVSWCVWFYKLGHRPNYAFYQPHARAWELAVGALLVLAPAVKTRWASETMGLVGLGLIGSGLFITSWPIASLNVIPAVAGSVLLMWPRQQSLASWVLSLPPMRWVGLISYSLYLWHWPVLVFFRHYANGAVPTAGEAVWILGGSIGLAFLTWKFVEKPIRRPWPRPVIAIGAGLSAAGLIAIIGLAVGVTGGFSNRLSGDAAKMASLDRMWEWECPRKAYITELGGSFCTFGAPWEDAEIRGVIWGDSHAEHMAPLVEAAIEGKSVAVLLYPYCPAILDGHIRRDIGENPDYNSTCADRRTNVVRWLRANPTIRLVVLSAAWVPLETLAYQDGSLPQSLDGPGLISAGIGKVIRDTEQPGRRFIVVAQVPSIPIQPTSCILAGPLNLLRRDCGDLGQLTAAHYHGSMAQSTKLVASIAKEHSSNTVSVLPGDALCRNGRCVVSLNRQFLYRDTGHLRRNLSDETKRSYASLIGLAGAIQTSIFGSPP